VLNPTVSTGWGAQVAEWLIASPRE